MLRRIFGALMLLASSLFILFLPLHLSALAQVWGTSDQPADWIENLGIALAIAAIGVLGVRKGAKLVSQPSRSQERVSRFSH